MKIIEFLFYGMLISLVVMLLLMLFYVCITCFFEYFTDIDIHYDYVKPYLKCLMRGICGE